MLEVQRGGGVARVFLDRREKANALDSALLERLAEALEALAHDDGLRAVVLGGHGKSFCGGADVAELRQLERLHGAVVGAGLELAAACDLRIAAHGTRFAMPEVRLGIPSVVEAALLPRLIGSGRAAWLVLTGEAIDAGQAERWGLVEQVCESQDLDRAVSQTLDSLLAGDREALRAQKALLQMWQEQPLSASVAASVDLFSEAYRRRSLR